MSIIKQDYGSIYDPHAETLIAPMQDTLVAYKNYAVGQCFILDGVMYRMTQPISQGSTIVIGTDCEVASPITEMEYNENTLIPKDITTKVENDRGNGLRKAIASGNLYGSGYHIGDYFYSHSSHSIYSDTDNTGSASTASSVKFKYTIADVDTYYGGYSNNAVVGTHHLAIIVDTMINSRWQTDGVTFNGYTGSRLQERLTSNDILGNIKSDLAYIIPSSDSAVNHLISHSKLFTKGTSGNEWAWVNSQVISALSEMDIYGAPVWSADGYQQGEAIKQLEVFRKYRFNRIFGNTWFWLRSLKSASEACFASYHGYANRDGVGLAGRAVGLILFY